MFDGGSQLVQPPLDDLDSALEQWLRELLESDTDPADPIARFPGRGVWHADAILSPAAGVPDPRVGADVAHEGDPPPGGDAPSDRAHRALADVPAGPELAQRIAALLGPLTAGPSGGEVYRLPGVDDDGLIDVAAAAQRLAGWATAMQMAALAEHVERQPRDAVPEREDPALAWTAQEASLECGVSRYAVENLVATALVLPGRLPRLHALLLEGRLEPSKARLAAEKVLPLSDEAAARVDEAIAPQIVRLTRPALTQRLDELVAAADPEAFADRVQAHRAGRRVAFRSLGDGMGSMTLITGAEEIEAARSALDALTMAAREAQPDLSPAAHAYDADRPWSGPNDPDGRHPAATRADTLVDTLTQAADLVDHDPSPSEVTEDGTEASNDDGTEDCTEDGARASTGDSGADPGAPAIGASFVRRPADVVVLVPLSVLTGASDAPALMPGYGPIPADLARDLARNGTWRCAVVDDGPGPSHGTLLGLGRRTWTPSYVPGPRLREFVRLRDGHCVFPGCRRSVKLCDLDHRRPWAADGDGGPTCACNLQALCRYHHGLKTEGRVRAESTPDGVEWTTPAGRRYRSEPNSLLVDRPATEPPEPEPPPPF